MATLLQSVLGGSATGSGTGNPFVLTTNAVGFGSATTTGSLLVCIVWHRFTTSNLQSVSHSAIPTTSGVTWTQINGLGWVQANPGDFGMLSVYYAEGAPSIPPANTTSVTLTVHAGGTTFSNVAVEFVLYEFSGVLTLNSLDISNNLVDESGSSVTVDPGTLTTSGTALILAAFQARRLGSNVTAGSGFTLGPNATTATIGQSQYKLSVPAGSGIQTAFTGTDAYFASAAYAFLSTPTTPILSVLPTTLAFTGVAGGDNPTAQNLSVANANGGTLNWTVTPDQNWLDAAPSSGVGAGTVVVTVNTSGLLADTYNGNLTFVAAGATGSPLIVPVTLTLTDTPPPPAPGSARILPLTQTDTWQLDHGMSGWPSDQGTPFAWHETTLPQQQVAIAPTPDDVGEIGLLYVALAQALDGSGIPLSVPDDWSPYIVWGTLGELLSSDGPAYDPVRAKYCMQRFDEGVELAQLVLNG